MRVRVLLMCALQFVFLSLESQSPPTLALPSVRSAYTAYAHA